MSKKHRLEDLIVHALVGKWKKNHQTACWNPQQRWRIKNNGYDYATYTRKEVMNCPVIVLSCLALLYFFCLGLFLSGSSLGLLLSGFLSGSCLGLLWSCLVLLLSLGFETD